MYENVLVVIPARGGSKGIPLKNLQVVGSNTLVECSIKAALGWVPNDNIIVSSDCEQILNVARGCNVVPLLRPAEFSTDMAMTELCLIHALESRPECKTVVTLQPTSPLRREFLLHNCLEAYYGGDYDSLLTVTKFYDFFWWEKQNPDETWTWGSTYNPKKRPMRQSLTRDQYRYFDNGSVYISDAEMLRNTKCRLGEKVCVYPISGFEGLQIDDPYELDMFTYLFHGMEALDDTEHVW